MTPIERARQSEELARQVAESAWVLTVMQREPGGPLVPVIFQDGRVIEAYAPIADTAALEELISRLSSSDPRCPTGPYAEKAG